MTGNEGRAIGSEVSNCTNENAPGSTQPSVLQIISIVTGVLCQQQQSSKGDLLYVVLCGAGCCFCPVAY